MFWWKANSNVITALPSQQFNVTAQIRIIALLYTWPHSSHINLNTPPLQKCPHNRFFCFTKLWIHYIKIDVNFCNYKKKKELYLQILISCKLQTFFFLFIHNRWSKSLKQNKFKIPFFFLRMLLQHTCIMLVQIFWNFFSTQFLNYCSIHHQSKLCI